MLWRAPVLAVAAITSLALGIGATTAIFTVVTIGIRLALGAARGRVLAKACTKFVRRIRSPTRP